MHLKILLAVQTLFFIIIIPNGTANLTKPGDTESSISLCLLHHRIANGAAPLKAKAYSAEARS